MPVPHRYPVTLWPIDVRLATLASAAVHRPGDAAGRTRAVAVLRVVLGVPVARTCGSATSSLKTAAVLPPRAAAAHAEALRAAVQPRGRGRARQPRRTTRPRSPSARTRSSPVGFDRDEGLLPYPAAVVRRLPAADRVLRVPAEVPVRRRRRAARRRWPAARTSSNSSSTSTARRRTWSRTSRPTRSSSAARRSSTCTRSGPSRSALTQQEFEYRVVPDQRRPLAHEVYSIDRVTATAAGRRARRSTRRSSRSSTAGRRTGGAYWHAARRPAADAAAADGARSIAGPRCTCRWSTSAFNPAAPADWTVHVETTCLNRDLPARLPFGGDQPRLQLARGRRAGHARRLPDAADADRPHAPAGRGRCGGSSRT